MIASGHAQQVDERKETTTGAACCPEKKIIADIVIITIMSVIMQIIGEQSCERVMLLYHTNKEGTAR